MNAIKMAGEKIKALAADNKRLLRWLVAVSALGFAGYTVSCQSGELNRLGDFRTWEVTGLFALFAVHYILSAFTFFLIIRAVGGIAMSFWQWVKILAVSRVASLVVAQSGNIYRAVVLKKRFNLLYVDYLSVYAFFSWVDAALNILIAFGLTLVLKPACGFETGNGLVLLGALLIVWLFGPPVAERILGLLHPSGGFTARVHAKLKAVLNSMLTQLRSVKLILQITVLGAVRFSILAALFGVCFQSLNVEMGLPALALFTAIQRTAAVVVITPANIGVREILYGLLAQAMGADMAHGVLVSGIIRVVHYTVVFVLGLALGASSMFKRRGKGKAATVGGRNFLERQPYEASSMVDKHQNANRLRVEQGEKWAQ